MSDVCQQPQQIVGINPYWLNRGLKAFYVLNAKLWDINLVTGNRVGTAVGSGHLFLDNYIETANNDSYYINLPLEGFSGAMPMSAMYGAKLIIGASIWSMYDRSITNRTGPFCVANTSQRVYNNNVLVGNAISTSPLPIASTCNNRAFSLELNNLRAYSNAGSIGIDTSVDVGSSNLHNVALGADITSTTFTNSRSQSRLAYFGVFDGVLKDAELWSLTVNPWQVLMPRKKLWIVPSPHFVPKIMWM